MIRFFACAALLVSTSSLGAQVTDLNTKRQLTGSIASGDTARYEFPAKADYLIQGYVDQLSLDVVIRIVAPGGEQAGRGSRAVSGREWFQLEANQEGDYQLQVIAPEGEAGDYTVNLRRLEPISKNPRKLADQLFGRFSDDETPGGVISVFRDGKHLFAKSYGMANLTYDLPFEVNTPTNIGSTSKQFTAFAIMLLAEQGELTLDDDIRLHIPELPDFGETITVRHLLTHTSGLREFLNLILMTGRRFDRGDYVGRDELISVVQRQPALQNSPGAEWNYNNTAFGFAALIVERISGTTFPDFMAENVFAPLGMTNTMVRPSQAHIVPGMAEGYIPGEDGSWQAIGDLGGAVGAGGIYSTVGDLQKWVENFSELKLGSEATFDQMMTRFVTTEGDTTNYGFGLFIDEHRGLRRIHHGGADVAHRSQLVYYPEIDAGITVQSNNAGFGSNIAFRFAEAFFGDLMEPEEDAGEADSEFDPTTYDPTAFDDFVGRYALDAAPAFILEFTRRGDSLFAQATGQPQFPIFPTSDSTFELRVVEASMTFVRDDEDKVTGVVLHQNGDQPATRLEGDAPEEWEPTSEELSEFTGRYFSEEIETFYTIEMADSSLVLIHRRLDDQPMRSGDKDVFNTDGLELTFERDKNEQVIAFYMSNGRTRDVRFARVP